MQPVDGGRVDMRCSSSVLEPGGVEGNDEQLAGADDNAPSLRDGELTGAGQPPRGEGEGISNSGDNADGAAAVSLAGFTAGGGAGPSDGPGLNLAEVGSLAEELLGRDLLGAVVAQTLSLGQLRHALAAKLGTADARLKEDKRVSVLLKGAMLAAHGRAIERQAATADEATHAQHGELVEHAVRVTPHAFATPEWIAEFLATAAATSTAVTLDDNTGRRQLYLRGGRDRATKVQCALLREKAQAEERASGAAGEFDKWPERVLEVQLHEMTALGPGDVFLDDGVLMLVGGRFAQPPHVDLEDGQRQSFGNVGDASPTLVHTGDRPTFESVTLQRGIDVRRATAADAPSLGRLRANPELLSPRSELQLAMRLGCRRNYFCPTWAARCFRPCARAKEHHQLRRRWRRRESRARREPCSSGAPRGTAAT